MSIKKPTYFKKRKELTKPKRQTPTTNNLNTANICAALTPLAYETLIEALKPIKKSIKSATTSTALKNRARRSFEYKELANVLKKIEIATEANVTIILNKKAFFKAILLFS